MSSYQSSSSNIGGFESVEFSSGGGSAGYSSESVEFSSGGGGFSSGGAGFASESVSFGGASGSAGGSTSRIAADLLTQFGGSSASGSGAGAASRSGASFSASGSASGSASFSASASGSGSAIFLSEIEQQILRSTVPITVTETENLTIENFKGVRETGVWTNKSEIIRWRGDIPITQYLINEDMNPEIITKRVQQEIVYVQELAIRYLRPPTPPAPGEILIRQESNMVTAPAPPLIIRQLAARAKTPEPLVFREAPPTPPVAVGRKVITIGGKRIPPPPRKVVVERMPVLPSKPQSVLVERWLPYAEVKRRVIFQRATAADAVVVKPRNVIVQWESPQAQIRKEYKFLGVIRANPVEYVAKYGLSLKTVQQLPQYILDIKKFDGAVLAADYTYNTVHELEGDVKALAVVDLEREGLSEYRSMLSKWGVNFVGASNVAQTLVGFNAGGDLSISGGSSSSFSSSSASGFGAASGFSSGSASGFSSGSASGFSSGSASGSAGASSAVIERIFASIDTDNSGQISVEEAALVLLKLNSSLGRSYGENESKQFFSTLDINRNGQLSLSEFKAAFARLL